MKRLAFAAVAALALAADAAWERAGMVQLTDTTGLMAAVAKFGEMTGNQMIGAMAASQLPQLPGGDFFGPMRQGASVAMPVYFDSEAFAKDPSDVMDAVEFAVVYPMALPKDEFLKLHPGAVETNGLLRVNGKPLASKDDWDDGDFAYVAFSEDGKWAVASDKPEQVAPGLACVAAASAPMGGDLVRLSVEPKGIEAVREAVMASAKADTNVAARARIKNVMDMFSGIADCEVSFGVGDAGMDIRGRCRTVEGSELAKVGLKTLPPDCLASAGADAVFAVSDIMFRQEPVAARQWRSVLEVVAKQGIDVGAFLKLEEGPASARLVMDVPALLAFKAAATNSFENLDVAGLCEAVVAGVPECRILGAAESAYAQSFAFAGFTPKFTAAQRFAATMPEANGKSLCQASAFSVSSVIRAVAPAVVASLPEADRASVQPLLALLPQECAGGIAIMCWRDGDLLRLLYRFSADEMKGLGACSSAVVAYAMMNNGRKASCGAEGCDNDGGDDDGDDD